MPKKLYEFLAVEGQLKQQATATRNELGSTFKGKRHLFEEKLVSYKPIEEGAQAITESQLNIQTTVAEELKWIAGIWTKALDTSRLVAEGNTQARADVVLDDGTVLLANLPAQSLLDLEHRAAEVQDLVQAIPTLDPTKGFAVDQDKGRGIYQARVDVKTRTKKVQQPLVKYAATQEHPAQVDVISVDIPAGVITQYEWSGMLTPADKGKMLERVEELRRALKAALHRANAVELNGTPAVGQTIFEYVFGPDVMAAPPAKK